MLPGHPVYKEPDAELHDSLCLFRRARSCTQTPDSYPPAYD
ncbi:Uncharacterised protein [Segatella copri]|nr:Uncharacterised protein [Segatella copri]